MIWTILSSSTAFQLCSLVSELILDRLRKILVQRRNTKIKNSLYGAYSGKVKGDLRVFCVSNKDYSEYSDEEPAIAAEHVELSGIPELRRYCQADSSEAQLRTVTTFLKNQVPRLLGSIKQSLIKKSDGGFTADSESALRAAIESLKEHFLQVRAVS